jgi:hypothetical protein
LRRGTIGVYHCGCHRFPFFLPDLPSHSRSGIFVCGRAQRRETLGFDQTQQFPKTRKAPLDCLRVQFSEQRELLYSRGGFTTLEIGELAVRDASRTRGLAG